MNNKYTTPVIKKNQPDDSFKFQPLPKPVGQYPYQLKLADVLPAVNENQLVFHIVGDTGNVRHPESQQQVVDEIIKQYNDGQFIYHLGDVVYHFGEADAYEAQFFKPYELYPGPVFAIAGNHDSDVNPVARKPYKSLDAFKAVFCDNDVRPVAFGGNTTRKSTIQPHIYWTLETPMAIIIGLHSNVPKFGIITREQELWFQEQLLSADADKMLILCVHHAPYSADINHGSSVNMIGVLERAFEETGIRPDIVFSGHVHNYQRFNKTYADGVSTPYIVAGAGGFDELHAVATLDDERFDPLPVKGIQLDAYCDTTHGFLKIAINKTGDGLKLTGNYFTVIPDQPAKLADSFSIHK